MKSKNNEVQNFLEEVNLIDPEKFTPLLELREIIFNIYPQVDERIMYGGIMFSLKSEDFSGLFVRKNHISIEFSNGYKMNDPKKFLEGSGKFRRHLKIKDYSDVKNKNVAYFVKQAL